MSCSSSIQCWDLNPQPLEHESFPITTRPGLPPLIFVFSRTKLLEVSTSPFQTKRNMFLLNSAVIDFFRVSRKSNKNLFLQRNFIKNDPTWKIFSIIHGLFFNDECANCSEWKNYRNSNRCFLMIVLTCSLGILHDTTTPAAAIAPWFRLHLPSCGPGFESQAHHLRFFQFVLKL